MGFYKYSIRFKILKLSLNLSLVLKGTLKCDRANYTLTHVDKYCPMLSVPIYLFTKSQDARSHCNSRSSTCGVQQNFLKVVTLSHHREMDICTFSGTVYFNRKSHCSDTDGSPFMLTRGSRCSVIRVSLAESHMLRIKKTYLHWKSSPKCADGLY